MAIRRRNNGRLVEVDCSTDHDYIWKFIWNWSRSYLMIHMMLVVVFILKQEKIAAIRQTMDDTLNRQWQKRKAEEAVTFWHTDKTPCLVCGEAVLWYTWHPQICGLRCISLWCALVHYNSLWEVTPSHVDIPRTFWRKMENEPKMSRFRPNSLKRFCATKILQIYAPPLNIQRFPVVTLVLIYQ